MAKIYVITNNINNKKYIGKTNFSIEKRFQEHIKDSKRRKYEKRPLYNAMNKYGIEYFSIKQLEECSAEDSAKREEYWIAKLNTYGHNGYNATRGGDSKKYYDYKEIANKYLELQNQRATARFFNCDVDTVKTACEEYNIKILPSKIVSKVVGAKPVNMYSLKTKEKLKTFDSLHDASLWLIKHGYSKQKPNTEGMYSGCTQKISQVARGICKTAYGFYWQFV